MKYLFSTKIRIVLVAVVLIAAALAVIGNLTGYTAYNEYITDVIISVIVYLSAFSLVIRMWFSGRKKKKAVVEATKEPTAEEIAAPPEETLQPPAEEDKTEEGGQAQ